MEKNFQHMKAKKIITIKQQLDQRYGAMVRHLFALNVSNVGRTMV